MPEYDVKAIWPGWETARLIGRGSFGAVYEIERDNYGHKEKAALKVISIPQSASDIDDLVSDGYDEESITSRFEGYMQDIVREYSMMADMKGCANIVYCDDWKSIQHDDGMGWDIFIKMELLTALPRALGKTITDEQVIKIGMDICNALVFCEKRNLLHRDIKPQNIFVAPDGTYKLGDFGIAKTAERTTSGTKTGTYKYMAPEVYNNQPYGEKADIYSLGLVLYWLLNERRTPFLPLPPTTPTSTEEDKARAKRFSGEPIPAPAHGSKELQRIVLKACAFNQKDRYQNAEAMLTDLEKLSNLPATVAPFKSEPNPITPEEEEAETVGAFIAGEGRKASCTTSGAEAEEENWHDATVGVFDRSVKSKASSTPEPYKGNRTTRSIIVLLTTVLVIAVLISRIGKNQPIASSETSVTQAPTTISTTIATPEQTSSPMPTPTPVPTPIPTLNPYQTLIDKCYAFDSSVELPAEIEMLDKPITLYVEGSFPNSSSGGMYLCKSPSTDRIALIKPHTPVTVYAVRGSMTLKTGHAFVETSSGQFGWIAFQSQRGTGIGLSETNDF